MRQMARLLLFTSSVNGYPIVFLNPSPQPRSLVASPSTSVFSSLFSGCLSWFSLRGGLVDRSRFFLVREPTGLCSICPKSPGFIDLFEVAVLVGACILVNYVTADSKTNWAEGMVLVVFYVMIVSLKSRVQLFC